MAWSSRCDPTPILVECERRLAWSRGSGASRTVGLGLPLLGRKCRCAARAEPQSGSADATPPRPLEAGLGGLPTPPGAPWRRQRPGGDAPMKPLAVPSCLPAWPTRGSNSLMNRRAPISANEDAVPRSAGPGRAGRCGLDPGRVIGLFEAPRVPPPRRGALRVTAEGRAVVGLGRAAPPRHAMARLATLELTLLSYPRYQFEFASPLSVECRPPRRSAPTDDLIHPLVLAGPAPPPPSPSSWRPLGPFAFCAAGRGWPAGRPSDAALAALALAAPSRRYPAPRRIHSLPRQFLTGPASLPRLYYPGAAHAARGRFNFQPIKR